MRWLCLCVFIYSCISFLLINLRYILISASPPLFPVLPPPTCPAPQSPVLGEGETSNGHQSVLAYPAAKGLGASSLSVAQLVERDPKAGTESETIPVPVVSGPT